MNTHTPIQAVDADGFYLDAPFTAEEHEHRFGTTNAYAEWLWNELKLLNLEMGFDASVGLYSPIGTIGGDFHFPRDGRRWQDVPKPSTRAESVLRAVGVLYDDDNLVAQADEILAMSRLALVDRLQRDHAEVFEALDAMQAEQLRLYNDMQTLEEAWCRTVIVASAIGLDVMDAG